MSTLSSSLTAKGFALIASITGALVAPAFADDANISAVLREIGKSASQGAQTQGPNALSAETARAERPSLYRGQRPAQDTRRVLRTPEVSPPFDFERTGHN